ncbi:CPBP family intramembrane glutamic endopeptidase [Clostridium beijerinckii]|uniref:CPBP family intramembrane metalloprotease n=1 Tax=Clostridium beijerinckii TaxID=1520 RepID=A0A7X9STX5_CLOBE|nr:CPBP family intramembrane glutamic endopeptidase [Clostridium beijerinckii]NMF07782.1 CPBP family intramembrane metalloprotease [Clostridium beijerinckii]
MKVYEGRKYFIITLVLWSFQFALLYISIYLAFKNNILISQNNVTWNNIALKFLNDYFSMLLLPSILIIANRRNLKDFGLCYESKKESLALLMIMLLLFILHNDFTITGVYKFFFYLVVVAFGEEFIFRGFVYNRLKCNSTTVAIILSGILWGTLHAIMPSILNNSSIGQLLLSMSNEIGSGILMGWYFIYIQEKSKTLWIPILIHAILDYTVGGIGSITAIGMFFYFLFKSKQEEYN